MKEAIYRISEAGQCPRKLSILRQLDKFGISIPPAPDWLETAAEEGMWHEGRIVNELRKNGWNVLTTEVCPFCLENGLGESLLLNLSCIPLLHILYCQSSMEPVGAVLCQKNITTKQHSAPTLQLYGELAGSVSAISLRGGAWVS